MLDPGRPVLSPAGDMEEASQMRSTMQDFPLTITSLFRRGRELYGSSEVVNL